MVHEDDELWEILCLSAVRVGGPLIFWVGVVSLTTLCLSGSSRWPSPLLLMATVKGMEWNIHIGQSNIRCWCVGHWFRESKGGLHGAQSQISTLPGHRQLNITAFSRNVLNSLEWVLHYDLWFNQNPIQFMHICLECWPYFIKRLHSVIFKEVQFWLKAVWFKSLLCLGLLGTSSVVSTRVSLLVIESDLG